MTVKKRGAKPTIPQDQTLRPKPYHWLSAVLVAIDQLGNALSGGYPDSTISARVGYNARHSNPLTRDYWLLLEWVINFSFEAIDGPDHCYQAYVNGSKTHYRDGSDLMRFILSLLIIINALPIAVIAKLTAWCIKLRRRA
ncbi:MAG: hypothetical protein PSN46_05400 [Gammaproteobacteria bacterium]|nr:hypothetical protein [Gammaproteobacteria bacterium]